MRVPAEKIEEIKVRRPWFKVWSEPWFDSSMRIELTNTERGIWTDLLALASKSRFIGIIASGRDPHGKLLGYPVRALTGMMISWQETDIIAALKALEETGRIRVIHTPLRTKEDGLQIEIIGWEKYQSEYQRTSKYYKNKKRRRKK